VLVGLATASEAAELLAILRAQAPSLESCDFFLDDGLTLVLEHQRRQSPVRTRAPVYVLAECAAQSDPTDELAAALEAARVEDAGLGLTLDSGGTISAEHGVGVEKARWRERARGAADVAAMRALKHALDPDHLLNPGAVLPEEVPRASGREG